MPKTTHKLPNENSSREYIEEFLRREVLIMRKIYKDQLRHKSRIDRAIQTARNSGFGDMIVKDL